MDRTQLAINVMYAFAALVFVLAAALTAAHVGRWEDRLGLFLGAVGVFVAGMLIQRYFKRHPPME